MTSKAVVEVEAATRAEAKAVMAASKVMVVVPAVEAGVAVAAVAASNLMEEEEEATAEDRAATAAAAAANLTKAAVKVGTNNSPLSVGTIREGYLVTGGYD